MDTLSQKCVLYQLNLDCDTTHISTLQQERTNPVHVAQAAKFCMKPSVCASSVPNLLPITHLVYRILRWLLDYRKICAPMLHS
jgi:hypothetical protein